MHDAPPIPEANALARQGEPLAALIILESWLKTEPGRTDIIARIEELTAMLSPEEREHRSQFREYILDKRIREWIPKKVLLTIILIGLASFVIGLWPNPEHIRAPFLGLAMVIFGGLATPFIAATWWFRLPFRTKGDLVPSRPFFYHTGATMMFVLSLGLIYTGLTLIIQGARV